MVALVVVVSIMAIALSLILGYPLFRQWQRQHLRRRPFPELWLATLARISPYPKLSSAQQESLRDQMQVFLHEKQFIGCQGVQVTEEMKVIIAAIACLLILSNRGTPFPVLRSILVYPDAYRVKNSVVNEIGLVEEQQEVRLGESWSRDQVVLAWSVIQRDLNSWNDGHNLILHEFAHQLDQADGQAEGVPILSDRAHYREWTRVMGATYQQLCTAVQQKQSTVLDAYGTLNPAEFFAVATETFFECPQSLQQEYPALYEQLQRYYELDPASWVKM
jgi:MtfA peptidase